MSLVVIGTLAFDAIETPFGKTDKIVGGAATYASLAASYFFDKVKIVAVVGDDFPQSEIAEFRYTPYRYRGTTDQTRRKIILLGRQVPQRHEQPRYVDHRIERFGRFRPDHSRVIPGL